MLALIYFIILGVIAIGSAICVLLSRHPLYGALSLVLSMLSLAGIYGLLGSPFIGVVQVMVYAGAIMMLLTFVIMVLNGARDSKTPMFVMIIVNLINIGLNPSLINGFLFFPELGIAGSAYATLISRSIGVVLLILAMYLLPSKKNSPIKFPKKWTFEPRLLRDLALIGLPSAVQSGLRSFAFVGMTAIITLFGGSAAMAAYGICCRFDMMGFILVMGLCVGVSVMVGQNLGAGKPERATAAAKYAIIINAAFMFVLGLVYFIFATPLLTAFGASGEWLHFGEQFMHIVPWSYAVIATGMTMGFAMNGAGATRPGMYAALVGMIGVQVGGSLLCVTVLGLGVSSIWFCIFISAFFTTSIDALFFMWGKWKKQKLNLGT